MKKLHGGIYQNRRVFLTGHTGFKGSWLALWLHEMGAEVMGYSLEPPTTPSHWDLLKLPVKSVIADIRDFETLNKSLRQFKPEIVFHLAAQPLVRLSYDEPRLTYETNVMGTLNLLEACRGTPSVQAIINVTSDKCYENQEWVWGYRENDPMGGYDPYSSSKGCSELLTSSYRNSFFNPNDYGDKHHVLLASARAGNVIGGGDWAKDRLVPDIMQMAGKKESVLIRNPRATRPWQHVLEPLSGYLMLGQKLLEGGKEFAEGWNFGPSDEDSTTVLEAVSFMKESWPQIDCKLADSGDHPHEASLLKLDCSKAHIRLDWSDCWDLRDAFEKTVHWYRSYYESHAQNSRQDLMDYVNSASEKKKTWAT